MRRRTLNLALGLSLLAPGFALFGGGSAAAQAKVDLDQALAPRIVGNPDAEKTLIEYFSLTCPHCARFHVETYPHIKEKYIDTGQVKMELRDFPLDQWALRAAALARCVPPKSYAAMIDVLLKQQQNWARSQNPGEALIRLGQLAGIKRDHAIACMENNALLDGILNQRLHASREHGVESTPSFVLDGEKVRAFTVEEFDNLLG